MRLFLKKIFSFKISLFSLIVFLFATPSIAQETLMVENSSANNPSIYSADIEEDFEETKIQDEYENLNRVIYSFNKGLDKVIFNPLTKTYRFITPVFVRDRVNDFLFNLTEPVNFANFIFQGNPEKAGDSLGRFLTNSTFGIGGLFDISAEAGLKKSHADFGLTLGAWGVGTGNYIVVPILGPSSFRDITGVIVDTTIDPFTYAFHRDFALYRFGARFLTQKESLLDFYKDIEKTSIDEYSTVRSIYFQKRKVY